MNKGFVALVGAGPGDKGLLTLKACEYISKAQIVVYDRLVSEEILQLADKKAKLINVGKAAANHTMPQERINQLLLELAQDGYLVVRLKGGDPFVFGRGGEELELLRAHGIAFEVVPGITSAIAAPNYAGIPVTHRDFCSSIHIVTGHQKQNEPLNIDFDALVRTKGTLVFLMGLSALTAIVNGLIDAGMSLTMPAAIVENGTRSNQRKVVASLETLHYEATQAKIGSPAIIIVGEVCNLADKYDWFMQRPLFGQNIVVTRPKQSAGTLCGKLKDLGARVYDCPCIEVRELEDNAAVQEALRNLKVYTCLAFTSQIGVKIFFEGLRHLHLDARALSHLKIYAIGTQTAAGLIGNGIYPDYVPDIFDGIHLAQGLIEQTGADDNILLFRAQSGNEAIVEMLSRAGRKCYDLPVYETIYTYDNAEVIEQVLRSDERPLVTFTSASTVEGFVHNISPADRRNFLGICIGKQTAASAAKYDIEYVVADRADIDSMIEKIKEVATCR